MDVDAIRARFPAATVSVFFDHASVGPISVDVAQAMRAVVDSHVALGFQNSWHPDMEVARADVAALVGSVPSEIAFTQNTSSGLSVVANGLDWRPGDNVVLPQFEFPSNYYPWLNLQEQGVELRPVPAPNGHADIADVVGAIDPRTRVVAISAVQYSTGYRYDLTPLADACDRGPLLVVDGTQCVGALRFDVAESGADVLAVSGHKWLMGPLGAGFVHLSGRARAQIKPSIVGWLSVPDPFAFDYVLSFPDSADRYEAGTENVVGILGLGAAARLMLEITPQLVEERVLSITDRLEAGLRAKGCDIISDRSAASRSGILIFKHPERGSDQVLQRLVDAGVRCAARGGGIRLSPHFYNSDSEADLVISVL